MAVYHGYNAVINIVFIQCLNTMSTTVAGYFYTCIYTIVDNVKINVHIQKIPA